jgi:two-component system, OmpR family, sensor histidine kinase PrrB
MRLPGSLRTRLTLAALAAVALGGVVAAALLLATVERDGRRQVDNDLRARAGRLLQGPGDRFGPGGGPGPGGERLLAGSGTFVQLELDGQVVAREGDVPARAPALPVGNGLHTVSIGGQHWRALTLPVGGGRTRVELLTSLAPVDERVGRIRRLVLLIGLVALALTGLVAWAFTSVAVRPLGRLRAGAARVTGTRDLDQSLPEDDGPDEVRSLAHALNEMLGRLRVSSEVTERALAATRRFAADAGHELRTPLTALRASVDTLRRNPDLPAPERARIVDEVAAEQERIVHLLEGLQALARGDAADKLPRERFEVGDVVDAALFAARQRHPGVRFELVDRVGDAVVQGWPEGVRLVADNLLSNAALHGRPHGRVDVVLERLDGDVLVRVDDDGPGIPAAWRERLLEPFARGPGANANGTGLGLAIVAQQVALHGGTLTLGDAPLGGLRVEARLPAGAQPG